MELKQNSKVIAYILLAIIGVILISTGLPRLVIPDEEPYNKLHEIYSIKVCQTDTIKEVYEKREISEKAVREGYKLHCELLDLDDRNAVVKQVIAMSIFYVSVLGAIMFWERRVAAVFLGLVAMIFLGVVPLSSALEHMELDLVIFLIAMMTVVGYLEETGFLRYVSIKMVLASRGNPSALLFLLTLVSFIMAALVDEVSSIVYVTYLTFEITKLFNMRAIPWVLVVVFATNIGSAATMIGNPIGIYIGLYFKLSFLDFIRYASPAAFTALLVTFIISRIYLRRDLKKIKTIVEKKGLELDPWVEVRDIREFYISAILFLITITGIALHTQVAEFLNSLLHRLYWGRGLTITEHDALIVFPVITAAIALIRTGYGARKLIEEKVEWWALLFFMFLFAQAAALSYSGVTDKIAYVILSSIGGGYDVSTGILANILVMYSTAFMSGFIDNMPVIVTLSPVAETIMNLGVIGSFMLPWSLLFGGTMGGNLTIIGSTANIVAAGLMEKRKMHVRFGEWIKIGVIVVLATLFVASTWVVMNILMLS